MVKTKMRTIFFIFGITSGEKKKPKREIGTKYKDQKYIYTFLLNFYFYHSFASQFGVFNFLFLSVEHLNFYF